MARLIAAGLDDDALVHVLNDVVLNQVLVAFDAPDGSDPDAHTGRVVQRIQAEGTIWAGSTRWQGRSAMRISVSNWSTTEADAERTVEAIIQAAHTGRNR